MPPRKTKEEFVENARKVHGDYYDYDDVVYVTGSTSVLITCKKHGNFPQLPRQHISKKQGCPKCGTERATKSKSSTFQEFIEKAVKIHGNRYCYNKVIYANRITEVIITCKTHGDFPQLPHNHLSGQGCRKCGGKNPYTTESFIEKSKSVHGEAFTYENTVFNATGYVTITCKIHGIFTQLAYNHLRGNGCKECSIEKSRYTRENFHEKILHIHGDTYDYSKSFYQSQLVPIIIICKKHGEFSQTPADHIRGRGCKFCAREKNGLNNRLTQSEFIQFSKDIHGDRFNYELVVYKTTQDEVCLVCEIHGKFFIKPCYHMKGAGCQKCNRTIGESFITNKLEEMNLNFELQKTFDGCKNVNLLKFDFFIPEFNLCIEFDGKQHFKPVEWFGGEKQFELSKTRDTIKGKFCAENGINLLRVKDTNLKYLAEKIKNGILIAREMQKRQTWFVMNIDFCLGKYLFEFFPK